ncbi:MAG: restriction endonuclease subunit S, partial [Acinetobacter baumannii]
MTDVKQLITEHLDIWLTAETEKKSGRGRSSGSSNTIYGVQKLRELIINFAITGKLVKNISTEISAFELLKKIMEDKKQKLKEGKIKKSNKKYIQPESDIKVPLGWEITIINNLIFDMDAGWSPACLAEPANQTQWGVLKTTAVQANSFLCFENKCLPENLTPKKEYEVQVGDILVTRAGPYNRVGIACYVEDVRPKLMISDKLIRLKYNSSYINGKFFALSINFGPTSAYLKENQSGMAESQVNISQDKLRSALISIPPLEEQQRIVEKVDELMHLCDQLEQQQTLSSDAHATLVDTLLKALTESNDADEFQDNWQRIVANFDLLFTTEYSIQQLKQTV